MVAARRAVVHSEPTSAVPGAGSKSDGMLPTFLTIGAMKCGTTSLHAYLSRHADIFLSQPKELDFFSDDRVFARGVSWYESQFRTDRPLRGETSPNYAKRHLFPAAAARIGQLTPDIRLLYLVRHPVERFLSNYVQSVAWGLERRTLQDLLRTADRNYSIMFDTGRYMYQLEAYLEHFPRERILVLRAEDLDAQHTATLNRILTFIGADAAAYPGQDAVSRHHESGGKGALRTWARPVSALGRPGRAILRRLPQRLTHVPIARPELDMEARARLMDEYREDIARLERFVGHPMGWS